MTFNEWNELTKRNTIVMTYISGKSCSVCHSLKPKIKNLIDKKFEKLFFIDIDISDSQEIPAQLGIFSIPAVILTVEGKESARLIRNFSLLELEEKISRPYEMLLN